MVDKDKQFQSKAEDKKDVGPLKDRSCTDVVCIIIFIVFLAGMGVLTWYAFNWGDPYRIINGYDSWGNVCGRNNARSKNINVSLSGRDLTDYPYLMYFDPSQMIPSSISISQLTSTESIETTLMICVRECPKETIITIPTFSTMYKYQDYFKTYNQSLCQYEYLESLGDIFNEFSVGSASDADYIQKGRGPCPEFVFQSDPLLSRCIPLASVATEVGTNEASDALKSFDTLVNNNFGSNISSSQIMQYAMSDVMSSYREIIVMCASSMIISFIIILLLGWIAQIMIYGIAVATAIACVAGPAYFWYTWYKAKEAYDALPDNQQLSSISENVSTLMIYAIVVSVVCVVVFLLILFLWSRVGLMVSLFKEAGFMVMRMIVILFTPILLAIFIVLWAAFWVFVSSYIYTAGVETIYTIQRDEVLAGNITTMYFTDRQYTELAWLYHLFGLYWGLEFLLACHEMALAGAFVQFYWTRDKRKVNFPVLRGIWWVFRYHLGTVAFGSCIIAVIQLIRTILAYIQNKTKDSGSEIVKYLLMCLQCCLWCFEKVMKFINRNAYIYTAFKGTAFCSSCKKVFGLLMANLVRVAVINCIGAFILFMGKFFVVVITVILGYFMMQNDDGLYFWAIPVLIAGIFSLAVAYCFFSVYEIGIDTIFICFAEDSTINDGTPGREYYMSKNLMTWVENSNEAMKNLRRKKKQQKQQGKSGAVADKKNKDKKSVYPSLEGEMAMEDIN